MDELTHQMTPKILERIRDPAWNESVNAAWSVGDHRAAELLRRWLLLFVAHLTTPEIESAAIFVIFGELDRPRNPSWMERFADFFALVIGRMGEIHVPLIRLAINSCLHLNDQCDALLISLLPPFVKRFHLLAKTSAEVKEDPVFQADIVSVYTTEGQDRSPFKLVSGFLSDRMKANPRLRADVKRQWAEFSSSHE
jgi:hypothetical protein